MMADVFLFRLHYVGERTTISYMNIDKTKTTCLFGSRWMSGGFSFGILPKLYHVKRI